MTNGLQTSARNPSSMYGSSELFRKNFTQTSVQTEREILRNPAHYETFEKLPLSVIPAQAGIQKLPKRLDSRARDLV